MSIAYETYFNACISMSTELFEGHWNSLDANLKAGKIANEFAMAIRAAMPVQQARADEEYKKANEIFMHEMRERMRRYDEMMSNPNGGDPNDPDERVRAGTHRRITESEETGAGKGRREPISYVVPIEYDSDSY
jgi:hypothetical protein